MKTWLNDSSQLNDDYNVLESLFFKFKKLTWRFRLRPSFIIIGAQKAGTTSLYEYLLRHPQVSPAYHKEIHYFDVNFEKSERWYRAHFPIHRPNLTGRPKALAGEATPYYLFHPSAPQRMATLYPNIKLICLLRDPVDRAYSHYTHNKRKGREKRSFEEAIKDEHQWLEKETKRLVDDSNYYSAMHHHFAYLARGVYIEQIKRWHQCFDQSNILIIESGEFYLDPNKMLTEVCLFLGLSEMGKNSFEVHNKQQYSSLLSDQSRTHLEAFFRPHNHRLYEYIGREYPWR